MSLPSVFNITFWCRLKLRFIFFFKQRIHPSGVQPQALIRGLREESGMVTGLVNITIIHKATKLLQLYRWPSTDSTYSRHFESGSYDRSRQTLTADLLDLT